MNEKISEKTKMPQWVVNALLLLVLTAYGFIFNSAMDRIATNEAKIENMNPVLLQIQTDLAEIKTDLKWLKVN